MSAHFRMQPGNHLCEQRKEMLSNGILLLDANRLNVEKFKCFSD